MSRVYVCTSCNHPKTAKPRGPLPKKCPECTGVFPRARDHDTSLRPPKSQQVSTRTKALANDHRVLEAIEMRLQYRTWDDVARELGWSGKSAAMLAVQREQERRRAQLNEGIDELRNREFERLEKLGLEALRVLEKDHVVVNSGTVVQHNGRDLIDSGPKLAAVNTLVKVSESLRKLLGLDAATKVDAAVTVQYTVQGIPESEMP